MKKLIISLFIVFLSFGVGSVSAQQPKAPKLKIVDPADVGRVIEKNSSEEQSAVQRIEEFKAMTKAQAESQSAKGTPPIPSSSGIIMTDEGGNLWNYGKTSIFLTTATVAEEAALIFYRTDGDGNGRPHRAIYFGNGFGPGLGFLLQDGTFSSFETPGATMYEVFILTTSRVERIATTVPVFSEEYSKNPEIISVAEQAIGNDKYVVTLQGNFMANARPTIVIGCCTVMPDSSIVSVGPNQIRFRVDGNQTYFPGGKNLFTVGQDGMCDSMLGRHRKVY